MADLNQAGLEAMKDSIKNVKVHVEQVDITDAKACEEFVANVAKEFGRIDVLCNNAGTGMMGDLLTFPEEVFRKHADLMMYAPIRLMNLCIPHFKENGWGSIVTMASMFGKQPGGLLSYDAIKAADIMISKDYSNYCAPFNVNVNSVCPGPVATPLWYEKGQLGDQLAAVTGKSVEESIKWFAETNIPMQRFAEPEEIANAAVYLASVPGHYITGTALNVDGGTVKTIV
ncbi:dehydrogenase [Streptococcus sobrinus]|uniref:Dehydrogenase n=1 Tax=Streptococcus sobrinus TaxID=1310 RepID=A0ABM6W793_9STRE|nr:SDR family oxidoreductase [Streptococcus sobrinus]AWN21279.1 dehydrogenase [Streptococcus sobrinus]EMP72161.1 dehydrogenase [Streptococcus sobrinus DSM 20742 = ATCC 33478]SQG14080.1 3-hydroxybutyrate dehydrogenase [Streptococcus sobrinus]